MAIFSRSPVVFSDLNNKATSGHLLVPETEVSMYITTTDTRWWNIIGKPATKSPTKLSLYLVGGCM